MSTTPGFKEWALVCEALGRGETSLILRKGGIAEGRDGFRFKHGEFYLFPTLFHEQLLKTRLPHTTRMPEVEEGTITIRHRAVVEWTRLITDRAVLQRLESHHILQPSVVEDRFVYDPKPGEIARPDAINVAFLRIFNASEPWRFPGAARYGGCRSWVDLPETPEEIVWTPILSDAAHEERARELAELMGI